MQHGAGDGHRTLNVMARLGYGGGGQDQYQSQRSVETINDAGRTPMQKDDRDIELYNSPQQPAAPPQPSPTRPSVQRPSGGEPKTSGMAIAAFVLSLLGCTAPIGVILGIVALVQISNDPRRLKGNGWAIAAIAIGAIMAIIALLAIPAITAWTALGTGVESTVDDVQNTLP